MTWGPLREQVAPSWAKSWARACVRVCVCARTRARVCVRYANRPLEVFFCSQQMTVGTTAMKFSDWSKSFNWQYCAIFWASRLRRGVFRANLSRYLFTSRFTQLRVSWYLRLASEFLMVQRVFYNHDITWVDIKIRIGRCGHVDTRERGNLRKCGKLSTS